MKKKIILFIFIAIIVGTIIFLRNTFVCKGDLIENVVYTSENLIIQQVQSGNKDLIIFGTGYSLSINQQYKVVKHDPFMILPTIEFQKETIMTIFYPFEASGLESSGKELSIFINSIMQDYKSITLIGHSKCGVCFANAARWIQEPNLNIVTISTPFQGTSIVDEENVCKSLNWFEQNIYTLIFSNHAVDKDLIPSSQFLQNADFSGLQNCTHINIVSKCPQKAGNLLDIVLMYFDQKVGINGDGVVPQSSQQSLLSSNIIEEVIEANHSTSFNIGVEISKELLGF